MNVPSELQNVKAERDNLARQLFNVLYNLHTVYANTSGPAGGIGGQAMTPWCHVNNPYTDAHTEMYYAADNALREQIRRAEREGYNLLETKND